MQNKIPFAFIINFQLLFCEFQLNYYHLLAFTPDRCTLVLNELEICLKENIIHVTPMAPIGKVIAYTLSRWTKLVEYIKHPFLEIDNNLVENAIRPTVIGRKNYMLAGSHEVASRSAMIYSFFGSCKMNIINPQEWLADVLLKINDTKHSQLYTLLPNFRKKS